MKLKETEPEAATAIVLVMSVLATLLVIAAVAAEYTTNISRNVQRTNTLESAIAIADGCLEYNYSLWRQACRSLPGNPKPTTNQLSTLALPTQLIFPVKIDGRFVVPNFTATRSDYDPTSETLIQQCKVVAADPSWQVNPAAWNPAGTNGTAPPADVGSGTVKYNYIATAYVTLPTIPDGNVVAKVQRVFQEQQDSPFNYALFYIDPLEIHPGPKLNITGWVHTNSDLYTAHDTLTFSEKAAFSGNWSVGFRPGDIAHKSETPSRPKGVTPGFEPPHQPSNLDPATFGPIDSNDPKYNPNNTGYHELVETPVANSPDPFADARYYNQASVILTVEDNPDPSLPDIVAIQRGNGHGTPTTLDSASTGSDKQLYDMFTAPGAITTNDSIQDNREQANVRVTTVDVSTLQTSDGKNWQTDKFNGVLYIHDTSATSSKRRAVRLTNGAIIPTGGLTVASPNPVYIKGDFNTGIEPTSNTGDPSEPTGTYADGGDYARQSCSVIADAVNILSNTWKDSLSGTNQHATPTTVNSAIVSGNVTTGPGFIYTGGAENFPRFLENWSGRDFTYYGSMIELFQSQEATGVWGKSNVYSAPNRKWYFDNNFRLNPPPGAGAFVTYTYFKGRWSLVP